MIPRGARGWCAKPCFAAGLLAAGLIAIPSTAWGQPAVKGQWEPAFPWPNVGIHVHVLASGKVMFWGRREWRPDNQPDPDLDPHDCTPRLWDPATKAFTELPRPGFNLFCSGHTFLADG